MSGLSSTHDNDMLLFDDKYALFEQNNQHIGFFLKCYLKVWENIMFVNNKINSKLKSNVTTTTDLLIYI